jgi:hypothetical protein
VNWLRNETVGLLADGAVLPEVVVSPTGVVTLPEGKSADKITSGLNYVSRAKTLRMAQGQQDGTGWVDAKTLSRQIST